jgi:hypothetical protein
MTTRRPPAQPERRLRGVPYQAVRGNFVVARHREVKPSQIDGCPGLLGGFFQIFSAPSNERVERVRQSLDSGVVKRGYEGVRALRAQGLVVPPTAGRPQDQPYRLDVI